MRYFRTLCLAFSLVALCGPALTRENIATDAPITSLSPEELRDEALSRLFAGLHTATSEQAAMATEQKIWDLWSRSDSATAEVLLGQAVVAMNASDNAASLEILDRIVVAFPNFAEAWNKRATLHFMLGNYETSLRDIEKVLELEPRHFGALAGRGMIYERQGKWGLALDAFRDALRMNPNMIGVKNAVKLLEKREQDI